MFRTNPPQTTGPICIKITLVDRTNHGDCYRLDLNYLQPPHWNSSKRPNNEPYRSSDKFRSIFSDNLQPIATRGKKARGTLLVDQHCGNGCSIKRALLFVSYYNEINGGHIGRGLFGGGVLPAQYCPCDRERVVSPPLIQLSMPNLSVLLRFVG